MRSSCAATSPSKPCLHSPLAAAVLGVILSPGPNGGVSLSVEFPALKVVNGAFDASSTGDIQKSCDKVKSQNAVSGAFHCESNNAQANQDTNGTTTGGSGGGGGGGGSDGKGENSAAGTAFNAALFGLVAVAALASAL